MRSPNVSSLIVCLTLLGLVPIAQLPAQQSVKENDAIVRVEKFEGEHLKLLKASGKFPVHPQDMRPFKGDTWSNDAHLIAAPAKIGDWIELTLPVRSTGKYRVAVVLTKAADYGIVQFDLNGKKMGEPIDCFVADKVVRTDPLDLGETEMSEGNVVLKMTLIGTNPKSVGVRNLFALDYVSLTRSLSEAEIATTNENRKKVQEAIKRLDIGNAKLVDNFVRLTPESHISTKETFTGPIEVVVVAKAHKNNIRLHAFNGACVIFNWEVNRHELRVNRPDGNEERESGSLATAQVQPLDVNA